MAWLKIQTTTLQEINISHLGKRKIIFKYAIFGGYVSFLEGKANITLKQIKNDHQLLRMIFYPSKNYQCGLFPRQLFVAEGAPPLSLGIHVTVKKIIPLIDEY